MGEPALCALSFHTVAVFIYSFSLVFELKDLDLTHVHSNVPTCAGNEPKPIKKKGKMSTIVTYLHCGTKDTTVSATSKVTVETRRG